MRVLLVDDDPDTRDAYSALLAAHGFKVTTAETGRQALNAALLSTPDVIVLDIVLPDMDGWETLRQLKARLRTRKIPVLVLSGHQWAADEVSAAPCERYLQKPCAPDELLRYIRALAPTPPARP